MAVGGTGVGVLVGGTGVNVGVGGMGVVYLAEDTQLKRTAALKFLPPALTHVPEVRERFMHEAQAAAALNHTNIVTVYEISEHEGRTYIAMEYVPGIPLRDFTDPKKLLAPKRPSAASSAAISW